PARRGRPALAQPRRSRGWLDGCARRVAPWVRSRRAAEWAPGRRGAHHMPYDLVLRGGRVIDPSQALDRIRDVAVHRGRVAAVAPSIPVDAAGEVVDVTGALVLPGLIDTHAHVYRYVTGRFGLEADMVGVRSGVTTLVDQGGPSCMTLPGFREFVVKPA